MIHVFPKWSWPARIKEASFRDLNVEGGFSLSATMHDGAIMNGLTVRGIGDCFIRNPYSGKTVMIYEEPNGNAIPHKTYAVDILSFLMKNTSVYRVNFIADSSGPSEVLV